MSEHNFWKSKTLVKRGLVSLSDTTDKFYYFIVKSMNSDNIYDVSISRQDGKNNCTCESGSLHAVGKNCSHIDSCKLFIKLFIENEEETN